MAIPEPEVRVTRYEVSCLPRTHPDASLYMLVVVFRGDDGWSVLHRGAWLDAEGARSYGWNWEDGREPATRQEQAAAEASQLAWLTRHHFDEATALELARRLAPTLRYRGKTVVDALARAEAPDA